jgi:perosamine synthetase
MKIPQFSPWVGKEEIQAIAKCIKSNWITEGPRSKEFSEKLLALIGSRFGVFAPNGTLALYLALRAVGIKAGDEVLVPDFTFIASATSVEMVGARPVFVDVNRRNFQIDLTNADKLVTEKTKAIMPVHIYGTVCKMDNIMAFAKKHKLKIVEDAAQAIGVHWKGKHAGTFGEVGCFSFFVDKTITTAEGGFVVTNSKKIYDQLLYLRNQGRINRGSFVHPRVGYNFRMTDIQNAMGLVQLAKLGKIKKRKEHILNVYLKNLKDVKGITFFEPEKEAEWIPFRFGILCNNAHKLMSFMSSKGIESRTFFYPLHKQPCFSYLKDEKHKNNDLRFPNSVFGYEHGICLPTFPDLKDNQIKYVCRIIKEFVK